jgi:ribokinase
MEAIEVIGIGAMNLDEIYQVENILDDGEAVVKEFKLSPGGSAANTICGLAKLGIRTGFIGAVGADREGKLLTKSLAKEGVDTSQVKVKPGAKTGLSICLSDENGKRSLYLLPGANSLLSLEDIDSDYLSQAKLCHLTSFVNESQLEMQEEIVKRLPPSVKLSLAPGAIYAAKGIDRLTPLLKRTNVLLINQSEIEQLTQENWQDGARRCFEKGCQVVAVTFGGGTKSGSLKNPMIFQGEKYAGYIFSSGEAYTIKTKPYKGKLIDATGAGDAFATGFLYGLLRGQGLDQCGHLGEMVARFSLAKIGAREGLPSLAQLSSRYRRS